LDSCRKQRRKIYQFSSTTRYGSTSNEAFPVTIWDISKLDIFQDRILIPTPGLHYPFISRRCSAADSRIAGLRLCSNEAGLTQPSSLRINNNIRSPRIVTGGKENKKDTRQTPLPIYLGWWLGQCISMPLLKEYHDWYYNLLTRVLYWLVRGGNGIAKLTRFWESDNE
jgi:hypothetical protein